MDFKDQTKLHLRPGARKHLTENHTVRVIKRRVPGCPAAVDLVPTWAENISRSLKDHPSLVVVRVCESIANNLMLSPSF